MEGLDESQSPQFDLLVDGDGFNITVQTSSLVGTTVYMEILLETAASLSNSVEVQLVADGERLNYGSTLAMRRPETVRIGVDAVCGDWILLRAYDSITQ